MEKAGELKARGNGALAVGHVPEALSLYTQALESEESAILYSNRALAHIKAESYGLAIADAEEAMRLDPTYVKAYYRRGTANLAIGKYKLALNDFKAVVKLKPKDRDARGKLKECEKAVKHLAFASALADEPEAVLEVEDLQLTDEFLEDMVNKFREQKKIPRNSVISILYKLRDILAQETSLVHLDGPYTICGDVHGQFYDLLRIFEINGTPSNSNPYIFNGDFVDRGSFSFEVVLTLFAYKVRFPHAMHLNRGNHETKNMTKIYGFEGEIKHKYDATVLNLFHECFKQLPLAACLQHKVLIVHGGLSGEDVTLNDIMAIDRVMEPPDSGLMCDLLWSDPQIQNGRAPSKRGVGLSFGPDVTRKFLKHNHLDLIIRSHEVRDNGYEIEHGGLLVTVFSAPNYCDAMGNKGAFVKLNSDLKPKYTTFDAAPHPNVRPMAYASPAFGL